MTAIKQVRKAVIPAAGLGTRFLPATKATPKEMLPIVDKPTIQYIIEEALASGIEDILIITGRSKRAIEDHFDRSIELELNLAAGGKAQELEMVKKISDIRIHYIRQKEPRGLGHAILCAKQFIGDEPFAVLLGDDVVDGEVPALKQLMDVYDKTGATVLGVQEVPQEKVSSYGIVASRAYGRTAAPLRSEIWSRNRALRKRLRGWLFWGVISSIPRCSRSWRLPSRDAVMRYS